MPLDPSIPLSVKPVQPFNGLAQLGEIRAQQQEQQIRQQQMAQNQQRLTQAQTGIDAEAAAKRQQQEVHDAATQAYEQIKGGNAEAILSTLKPEVRAKAEGWLSDFATSKKARETQAEADGKRAAQFIQATDYNPVVAATAIKLISDLHPEAAELLNHATSPEALKKIVDHFATLGERGATPAETETARHNLATEAQAAVPKPIAEPTSIDAAILAARGNGPEMRRLLNLKGQMTAAGRAPTTATDSKMWVTRNGEAVRVNEGEIQPGDKPYAAAGSAGGAAKPAERQALSFYQRAKDAHDLASPIETSIAKMSLAGQARLQAAPNWLQSEENQAYRQSQRAFTEARLRKESGAAIPPQEFESDAKTYWAQPGDGPAIIKQKQHARETLLNGLAFSAGNAYEEFYGEPRPSGKGEAAAAAGPAKATTPAVPKKVGRFEIQVDN